MYLVTATWSGSLGDVLLQHPIHFIEARIGNHLAIGTGDSFSAASGVICETGDIIVRVMDLAWPVPLIINSSGGTITRIGYARYFACGIIAIAGSGGIGGAARHCHDCLAPIVVIDGFSLLAARKNKLRDV